MIDNLLSTNTSLALEETLHFAEARHEVLAGNVANWNTPGYEVRDLSPAKFQEKLREALASQASFQRTPIAGTSRSQPGDDLRTVSDDLKTIRYHDGSNVGLEQQVTELVKNQLLHDLTISLLQKQFQMLHTAIRGQVSV